MFSRSHKRCDKTKYACCIYTSAPQSTQLFVCLPDKIASFASEDEGAVEIAICSRGGEPNHELSRGCFGAASAIIHCFGIRIVTRLNAFARMETSVVGEPVQSAFAACYALLLRAAKWNRLMEPLGYIPSAEAEANCHGKLRNIRLKLKGLSAAPYRMQLLAAWRPTAPDGSLTAPPSR